MSIEIYEGEEIYEPSGDDGHYAYKVKPPGFTESVVEDYKFIVVVRADEGVPHHPLHPRRPYIFSTSFRTRAEAEAYAAGWSPALIARYVSLPHYYFQNYDQWALKPGWLTRAARDRYFKSGPLVGALSLTDADFLNGITMAEVADLQAFRVYGARYLEDGQTWVYRQDAVLVALVEGAIARLETASDTINLEYLTMKVKYLSEQR